MPFKHQNIPLYSPHISVSRSSSLHYAIKQFPLENSPWLLLYMTTPVVSHMCRLYWPPKKLAESGYFQSVIQPPPLCCILLRSSNEWADGSIQNINFSLSGLAARVIWGFAAKGGESTRPPGLQTTTNYEYGGLTFWHEKNCHFKLLLSWYSTVVS